MNTPTKQPNGTNLQPPLDTNVPFMDDIGVVIAAIDSACGYAALTLMEPDFRVLTVELKVNLLSVASGERLLARGQVLRPGRTLTVCRGNAYAGTGEKERHVATILTTMIAVGKV